MSARIAFVLATLLTASASRSQPQPAPAKAKTVVEFILDTQRKARASSPDALHTNHPLPASPPAPASPLTPSAPPVSYPSLQPLGPTTPAPREKSVDDLLAELEDLQAQKARIEKQEAELKAALRKKLDTQAERLKKVGVAPGAKEKEQDRVGQILIEGNTKTPDQKILDKLDFRPGQILQYPALEASRAKLEKAGFCEVTVEVIAAPNKLDSTFKDVRVKVTEPKPKPIVPPPAVPEVPPSDG